MLGEILRTVGAYDGAAVDGRFEPEHDTVAHSARMVAAEQQRAAFFNG
jgi:hypothetical protein